LKENPKIHKGDAEVLALAYEFEGIALLDDEEARGMAEIEGILHHGTIYLLLRMMKMGLLTKEEILDGLNKMILNGWRCSIELYAEILKVISLT
jgi:predicted nucleic acid-binding protein